MSGAEANWPSASTARTYRPQGGQSIFGLLCGMVFLVIGLISVWQMASWLGALFAIFGAYIILSTQASKLVIRDDAIEIYTLFHARTIRRDEIRGWRWVRHHSQYNSPPQLVFKLRDGSKAGVSSTYSRIPDLKQWLNGLTDLDAEDRAASLREIAADPEIGATPEDRLAALQNAKTTALVLNVAGLAAMFWGLVYPRPYLAAIAALLLLPVIAAFLTLTSPGLFRIYSSTDHHVLEWNQALWPLLIPGIGLFILAFAADASLRASPASAALLLVFALPYGIGAGLHLNALADRSRVDVFATHVVSKHAGSGRNRSYNLTLAPWGPQPAPSTISVDRRFYARTAPGDTVCAGLHQGGLGIRWYAVKSCRDF